MRARRRWSEWSGVRPDTAAGYDVLIRIGGVELNTKASIVTHPAQEFLWTIIHLIEQAGRTCPWRGKLLEFHTYLHHKAKNRRAYPAELNDHLLDLNHRDSHRNKIDQSSSQ
jgi:hypothetical protein